MFKKCQNELALDFYAENGFVAYTDLLSKSEVAELVSVFDATESLKNMSLSSSSSAESNDAIFLSPVIEKFARHEGIIRTTRELLQQNSIELQHSKINIKRSSLEQESFELHQDYPFFPHSNYDLLACAIHLDDQDERSGPIEFIPGSHKRGALSHVEDGAFVYQCTEDLSNEDVECHPLVGPAGMVSFHHCLTLHRSSPMLKPGNRRILFFQYRATDAAQLAGVIWKSTGYQVCENVVTESKMARFPDGHSVELRGLAGRLIDRGNKLKADN